MPYAGEKIRAVDIGTFQSYTPTLTGVTGTATAEYAKVGDLVVYRFHLDHTGSGTGVVAKVSLPVQCHASYRNMFTGIHLNGDDVSAGQERTAIIKVESGGNDMTFWSASSAGAAALWFGNSPVAWVSGDKWDFTFMYKAVL